MTSFVCFAKIANVKTGIFVDNQQVVFSTVFRKARTYSIKKLFLKYFLILFLFTSGALILYSIILVKTHHDQIARTADNTLGFYLDSLVNELNQCALFEQKLCYSDSSFQMLTTKNLKDTDKVIYLYNVKEMLERQTAPYEAVFVFNESTSVSTFAAGSSFSPTGSQYLYFIKESLRSYWLDKSNDNYNQWLLLQVQGQPLLMRAEEVRDVYVATVINLNGLDFLTLGDEENTNISFGFFDSGRILSGHDSLEEAGLTFGDLEAPSRNQLFSDFYLVSEPLPGTDISMYCLFQADGVWTLTRWLTAVFISLAFITCAVIIFIFYSFNRLLLYPLIQTNAAMKHLEEDDPAGFLADNESRITEYQNINDALASLLDQKVTLSREKENEAFEKDHAKLQYYQLQTRSHFFVNCLKSLYNMLENREYEKMQRMIIAFSNHLRYVFHDNLKLVSLQDELDEVKDYYNIILLDRASPFIMNTQTAPALLDCRVPSLIIQTFLENTAKYNRQTDNLLIFDVKIDRAELNGVPVMQIILSDNGVGYSAEMLKRLNSPQEDLFATKHVGISNLKHRVSIIYKKDYQFAFYNKPSGGACSLIYLPILRDNDLEEKEGNNAGNREGKE